MRRSSPKRITQAEIARLAGTDQSTVSHVLAGRDREKRIGQEVARRVREVARETGYAVNHRARALVTGRSRVLAVLMPMRAFGLNTPIRVRCVRRRAGS